MTEKYVAYLTQAEDGSITARVVKNEYPGDIIWDNDDTGQATGTRANSFGDNTFLTCTHSHKGETITNVVNNDKVRVTKTDVAGNEQNGLFYNTRVSICQD